MHSKHPCTCTANTHAQAHATYHLANQPPSAPQYQVASFFSEDLVTGQAVQDHKRLCLRVGRKENPMGSFDVVWTQDNVAGDEVFGRDVCHCTRRLENVRHFSIASGAPLLQERQRASRRESSSIHIAAKSNSGDELLHAWHLPASTAP